MRAAILSIGSELLHGFLTDTNSTFLAQELNALGVEVIGVFQVGDDLTRIVQTFRHALHEADFVIATGGIGPTDDDLTREAVAEVAGEQVQVDQEVADGIRQFFAHRSVPMPEQNVKQAWIIPSAELLLNPMGTAPGWFVRLGDRRIAIMPGVPREMFRMWREQALPRFAESLASEAIVSRTLKTIGIGESAVELEILAVVRRGYPVVATYAKDDGVHIRITAMSKDYDTAESEVNTTECEVRAILGRYIYGYLDDGLASAILRPIIADGERISLHEAGSAGRLTALLADVDESDSGIAASLITSFAEAATATGSQEPAAIASWCASNAARTGMTRYACGIAVNISRRETADRAEGGIAISIITPSGEATRTHQVTAVPPEIRRRATMLAADFLWSTLSSEPFPTD